MQKKIILIGLILSIITINAQSDVLKQKLNDIKDKYNLVGLSVSLIKEGELVFNEGLGLRDISRKKEINEETKYRIASISKLFTAIAAVILNDHGKIKFDNNISEYLGFELVNPNYPDKILTVRDVLSHIAGLRDGNTYSSFTSATFNNSTIPHIKELLQKNGSYYSSTMWSNINPEENYFQYANINYAVIGTMIEKVSGLRFDVFCKQYIFSKMSLDASFNVQDINNINDVAVLYRKKGTIWSPQADNYRGKKPVQTDLSGYQIGTNGLLFGPQGSLRASSSDLSKIILMIMNNGKFQNHTIISEEGLKKLFKINWSYNGSNGNNYYGIFNSYALGNHLTTDLLPDLKLTGHPGEAYGLISDLYFDKEKKVGIVFLTNGGQWGKGKYSGWYNVEEEVFNACYDELANFLVGINKKKDEENLSLEKNFPNPFNPETTISFNLNKASNINLSIYDMQGSFIKCLVKKYETPGTYNVKFSGEGLSSGVYIYRLTTDKFSKSKKMILLK